MWHVWYYDNVLYLMVNDTSECEIFCCFISGIDLLLSLALNSNLKVSFPPLKSQGTLSFPYLSSSRPMIFVVT